MSDVILLLNLEHTNMSRLLDLIDQQLVKIEEGVPPDYTLLHHVVDYFAAYPAQCHHPIEDLLFRKLCRRDPAAARQGDLLAQHDNLAEIMKRLGVGIAQARDGLPGSLPALEQGLRDFVRGARHHMEMEEQHFFPAAVSALSADDWEEIDFDLFDRADPYFDRAAEQRFRTVRERLIAAGCRAGTEDCPAD